MDQRWINIDEVMHKITNCSTVIYGQNGKQSKLSHTHT